MSKVRTRPESLVADCSMHHIMFHTYCIMDCHTEGCRQAKELVTRVTPGLTQFALRQCRRDLRTLVYLLTGHNTLNRHLTIMRRVNDPLCPLYKEEEETSLHFLGKCCATANIHRFHFGVPFLEPGDLKQTHWITLLRFAKTTKIFQ